MLRHELAVGVCDSFVIPVKHDLAHPDEAGRQKQRAGAPFTQRRQDCLFNDEFPGKAIARIDAGIVVL